jgi:hypothetical protein
MNHYDKVASVKQFTDNVATIYGTEDFSIYLYSLVKMKRPKTIVELGTGVGSVALWCGLGLEENNLGKIYTVDDGSDWSNLTPAATSFGDLYNSNYKDYITNLLNHFELNNYVVPIHSKIDIVDVDSIDILFSDFAHSPFDVVKLISYYLPKMSECSSIFIDSASTLYSSYCILEKIVESLNKGMIPRSLLEVCHDVNALERIVKHSTFRLEHIIENKNRDQNSTARIDICPKDVFPYPRVNMRF